MPKSWPFARNHFFEVGLPCTCPQTVLLNLNSETLDSKHGKIRSQGADLMSATCNRMCREQHQLSIIGLITGKSWRSFGLRAQGMYEEFSGLGFGLHENVYRVWNKRSERPAHHLSRMKGYSATVTGSGCSTSTSSPRAATGFWGSWP